jgi:serine/threonine-protein kinase
VGARLFGSCGHQLSSGGHHSLTLEEITRRLAEYLGPLAKIVIKKLAAQSDDLEFIYREAARQISNEADRTAFLNGRK